MELQEFVQKTIVGVISGVREAREEAMKSHASLGYTMSGSTIEFDVAITAVESSSSGANGGIAVWGIGVKGEGKAELSNTTVSRVRFAVPISYPASGVDPMATTRGRGI